MNSAFVPRGLLMYAALVAAPAAAFAQAPANDSFAAAEALISGVVTPGTNVNATVEPGEPPTHWTLTYAAGAATGKSVWYSYTPQAGGLASFSVVAQGTGTAAAALQAAAYTGTDLSNLVRVASASSTAGGTGTAGTAFPGNLFAVTAGVPVFIQVTGTSATGATPFDLTVSNYGRTGTVVLPRYSNWEWLHTTTGVDPTAAAAWATTWKMPGDLTDYGAGLVFSTPQPAPLGFAALDGAPGVKSDIGTAASGATNNAAYARTTFTLPAATGNLWAEVVADDGAYIYVDDLPGVPVHIAAALTTASTAANTALLDHRPQPDAFLSGTLATGCRAYAPAGLNVERNTKMVFLGGLAGILSPGPHRIAVSLHQTGNTSSDMAFDLQLIDMGAWPLASGDNGINFTDVPFVNASATATVVPAVEHHYAPGAGATGLAWYCVAPATSPRQGTVTADTSAGSQKVLRFNGADEQRFVTEPIYVEGLPQFVASLRILTRDTSSGFEAEDGFRVFLETSEDGLNFSEPATPLELQPQVDDDAALDAFKDAWGTKALPVIPNPYKYVRMVITGGTNSTSEYIYFDDIRFGQCQMFTTTTNVVYDNKATNDRADDTVSFDLAVTASGNTAITWTTSGFGAGSEVSGTIGGLPVSITRPAADAGGVRQNVVFSVSEDANPACAASVTVTTPAAAIGTITISNPVRASGANLSTTADDTFTYTVNVDGTATGVDYEIRSSDTGNTQLYGTGTYGTAGTLTLPASVTSLTIRDNSVPTLLKAAALPPAGSNMAMGRVVLSGASSILYSNPGAVASTSKWAQATGAEFNPVPADLELTVNETTTVFRPPTALATPEEGLMESAPVIVAGLANVVISASLRTFEDSTTSGFEVTDTFKIEVIEERTGGDTTVNLITGHTADDSPANDVLNGYTGTTADPYNNDPARDEFNTAGALIAANSRGSFTFSHQVPLDVLRVRVRVTAANDSANEFFFLHSVVVTDDPDVDTDGDGLSDAWEISWFGDIGQSGTGDSDGDGQNNLSEQAAGTNPASPASVLQILAEERTGDLVSVTFSSVAGRKYIAQSSGDLTSWTDTGSQTTATTTSTTIANLPIGADRAYYRVRLVP
jgi:hypothetical protein